MPEAVIVATARTPIGRAIKGSLVDIRPDDLAAHIVEGGAGQGAPRSTASLVEDLIMGCGQPAGEAGFNIGPRRRDPRRHAPTSPASPSTATARRRCRPSAWPPTPSRPARATSSSPPASRP